MRFLAKTLSAASALLLLAACNAATEERMEDAMEAESGGEADVEINDDGSMHVETEEGTFDAGSGEMPANWPDDVPEYAGATVAYSASVNPETGEPGVAVVLMTSDSAETVMNFYKDELAANGWTIEASMNMGTGFIVGATKENRTFSLMAQTAEGQTTVTLGISEGN